MERRPNTASQQTKQALAAALKELMAQKPIENITIHDLTEHCGIRRQTFYYHFEDVYDLLRWMFQEEGIALLEQQKGALLWQEGLLQIFEAVYENKAFIINAYHAVSREQIENYLFQLTHDLIMGVVLEQSKETALSDAQKNFIADFYKYSFVGIMLDWIRQGMKDDYTSICDNMCITIQGNITNSIKNFTNVFK